MMIHKRLLSFALLAILALHTGRLTVVEAYRIQYRVPVQQAGTVLGTRDEVEYTYVVRAKPTATPTPTGGVVEVISITIAPPSPTPTTATQGDWIGGLIALMSVDNNNNNGSNNGPTMNNAGGQGGGGGGGNPTNTPAPTATPYISPTPSPVICNTIRCNANQVCHQSVCRNICSQPSQCQGVYQCIGGVCLPQSSSYNPMVQAPTATPPVVQTTSSSSSSVSSMFSSSSSYAPPSQTNDIGPSNTPFPTRIPVNRTFYSNTSTDSPSAPPLPSPTPIPEFLKGKSSTIVVEMPAPPDSGSSITVLAPVPTPLILKGEDMKVIKIGLAKAPEEQTTTLESSPTQDLDITIEAKKGGGIEISQQEFVIQKGMHTVTISANENKQGSLLIEKNDTHARITMPVSIDPTTNILTVDTPQGPMKVSIMPDDALAIIRELRVVDKNKAPNDIVLESNEGSLQYKVSANKEEKLLGVIPLTIPRDVYVSADTGGLMKIEQTALWEFVTLFTF